VRNVAHGRGGDPVGRLRVGDGDPAVEQLAGAGVDVQALQQLGDRQPLGLA
jgi:hypothetical protein